MESNDHGVDWREVAFMLNSANEVLADKVHKLNQDYTRLQEQNKMQNLSLFDQNCANENN